LLKLTYQQILKKIHLIEDHCCDQKGSFIEEFLVFWRGPFIYNVIMLSHEATGDLTNQKTANFFPDIIKKSSSKSNALLIFLLGYYSLIYRERLHLEEIVNSATRKTSL
jgi:hypothetical protein